jgi:hypothetical protein
LIAPAAAAADVPATCDGSVLTFWDLVDVVTTVAVVVGGVIVVDPITDLVTLDTAWFAPVPPPPAERGLPRPTDLSVGGLSLTAIDMLQPIHITMIIALTFYPMLQVITTSAITTNTQLEYSILFQNCHIISRNAATIQFAGKNSQ